MKLLKLIVVVTAMLASSTTTLSYVAPAPADNTPSLFDQDPVPLRVTQREKACLVANAYHEARSDGLEGMRAVTHVVLNRAASGLFPDDVCGVVHQPSQFSWTLKSHNLAMHEKDAKQFAEQVVDYVLKHHDTDPTEGSLFFHHHGIKRPVWTRALTLTARIGDHLFYTKRVLE